MAKNDEIKQILLNTLKEIESYDRPNNENAQREFNSNRDREFRAEGRNDGNKIETQNYFKGIEDFLPNFDRKIICIFGLNMSGKTTLAKYIMRNSSAVVFDVLKEYDYNRYDVYQPKKVNYPEVAQEFDLFIDRVKDEPKWNLIVVDEANRIFPNRKALFPRFRSFLDTYRHFNKTIMFICRRPSQLFTDIPELAHYLIFFNLKGKNDIEYINSLNRNAGEVVYSLPKYHFVVMDMWRNFYICKPIPKNV